MQSNRITQMCSCVLLIVLAFSFMSFTVVIDAGHGGEDPGAIGLGGTYEKHIVLAMAKQLRDVLKKNPQYKIIYKLLHKINYLYFFYHQLFLTIFYYLNHHLI